MNVHVSNVKMLSFECIIGSSLIKNINKYNFYDLFVVFWHFIKFWKHPLQRIQKWIQILNRTCNRSCPLGNHFCRRLGAWNQRNTVKDTANGIAIVSVELCNCLVRSPLDTRDVYWKKCLGLHDLFFVNPLLSFWARVSSESESV